MRRDNYAVLVNEFLPSPWTHLFNTPQFFEIHRTENACYLQLVAKASGEVLSTIHFAEPSPGVFRSPRLGTFGSFDFKELPSLELVELFADETERILRDRGATEVEIISPPFAHAPELSHLVFLALHHRGYVRRPTASISQFAWTIGPSAPGSIPTAGGGWCAHAGRVSRRGSSPPCKSWRTRTT